MTESNLKKIYDIVNWDSYPYKLLNLTEQELQITLNTIAETNASQDTVIALGRECAAGTCSDEDLLKRLCEALRLGGSGIDRIPNSPVRLSPYPINFPLNLPCPDALKQVLGCNDLTSCIEKLIDSMSADFIHRWQQMEDIILDPFSDDLGRVKTSLQLLDRLNKLAKQLGCAELEIGLQDALDPSGIDQRLKALVKCLLSKASALSATQLKQILTENFFTEDNMRWFARHIHRGWYPLLWFLKNEVSDDRLLQEIKTVYKKLYPSVKPPERQITPEKPPPQVVPVTPTPDSQPVPGQSTPYGLPPYDPAGIGQGIPFIRPNGNGYPV